MIMLKKHCLHSADMKFFDKIRDTAQNKKALRNEGLLKLPELDLNQQPID